MTRPDRIRLALDALQSEGRVRSWYAYAPGDCGRRWVVGLPGGFTRSYSTRECEAFLDGTRATP